MIIINDNDYSNPYDEKNDSYCNKRKIKEWITKIIKVLPIITEIIKILIITIMIIIVKIIINNSNL